MARFLGSKCKLCRREGVTLKNAVLNAGILLQERVKEDIEQN